jgi:hypothetical protein
MTPRRELDHALRDAAEALRAVAETVCKEDDRDDHSTPRREPHSDRRGCFGSSQELSRLGRALLEAVEVVREAATHRDEPDLDESPACDAPCLATAPAPVPPYPPYPPYAPYAPFPPYPPYPPVVVIGGGGCGCSCQQAAPAAAAMPAPSVPTPTPPPISTPPPPPPISTPPTPPPIRSMNVSVSDSAAGFPDPASLGDVEALLDIAESVAALVRRTFPHPPEGPGA